MSRALRRAVLVAAPVLLAAAAAPVSPVAPGVPWTAAGTSALAADLDALLAATPALRGAHYALYAVETASGNVLYARAADDEMQPASTFKLLVGSAALDRLGPQFRWRTSALLARGAGLPEVVLRAAGDPTLTTVDLENAAAAVPARTIGRVRVDASALDARPYEPGWTWDDFGEDYAAPVSAATLDENVVTLRVAPGARAGAAARIEDARGRPVAANATFDCTGVGGAGVVRSRALTGAPGSDDTIDAGQDLAGCPEVVGAIPAGAAPETLAVAVAHPAAAFAAAFARALRGRGLAAAAAPEVSDGAPPGPAGTPFWTHDSQPLGALLGPRFWIPSDNLFGELLLKELGHAASGAPGTAEGGRAVENAWLASLGIDPATLTIADGCGMSQYDRITARALVTILQHDWNGPYRDLVLDSLPVGAARGTIEGIAGTPGAGRVFAKTGSMMHVRGLAGYLATERHGAVTFAFELDDWNGAYPAFAALRAQVLARIVTDAS